MHFRTTYRSSQRQRGIANIMAILAWLTFMVLAGFFFHEMLGQQHNPNQSVATKLGEGGMKEVVLKRNRYGHYVTSGAINGEPVVFLLDTGATGVAVPAAVAKRLGLQAGQPFQTRTANGIAVSYATRLDRVSVGDISLANVRASITPGLTGEEILLGMSFLRQVEFTQRGDMLTLRQYP
jgi:aspartyl protease family protein